MGRLTKLVEETLSEGTSFPYEKDLIKLLGANFSKMDADKDYQKVTNWKSDFGDANFLFRYKGKSDNVNRVMGLVSKKKSQLEDKMFSDDAEWVINRVMIKKNDEDGQIYILVACDRK